MWVVKKTSNQVSKVGASDGVVLGTFDVGLSPVAVAFDGANIWVANSVSGTVSRLPDF
jgi:DNA-binding beta-propeller fold protein YncE